MTHFDDELTRQLADANPVRNPELTELERRRSEKHLQAILGDARAGHGARAGSGAGAGAGRGHRGRWLLGAAAAVSAIALGTGLLPSLFNGHETTATAEEILHTAGESSCRPPMPRILPSPRRNTWSAPTAWARSSFLPRTKSPPMGRCVPPRRRAIMHPSNYKT